MMKLRKIFKKKQNLEQIIESTSLVTDEDEINTNDLLLLVDVLTNQDKQKEKSKIQEYLRIVNQNQYIQQDQIRIKTLLSIHFLFYQQELGQMVASVLRQMKNRCWNGQQQERRVEQEYQQYLQRLGYNIDLLNICKLEQYPKQDQLISSRQQTILWLFKICNQINQCTRLIEKMSNLSFFYQESSLLNEMILLLWSDLMIFYKFEEKEVKNKLLNDQYQVLIQLNNLKQLSVQQCLEFSELYKEVLIIKDKVIELYKNKEYYDKDNVIRYPIKKEINKQQLIKIQEQIIKSKVNLMTFRSQPTKNYTRRQLTNEISILLTD